LVLPSALPELRLIWTLELRTSTSFARLWYSQRKTTDARDLLAPVDVWFTEAFDTVDLKEANALLDRLSLIT